MVVTVLAVASILLLGFLTLLGYKAVIRGSGAAPPGEPREKCAVCRQPSPKSELVERQIGDYKLLYFCRDCIVRLAGDVGMKHPGG